MDDFTSQDSLADLRSPTDLKSPTYALHSTHSTPRSSYFPRQSVPLLTSTPTRTSPNARDVRPLSNLKFSRLLLPILQDAQTRMVFRAQAIIQNEVLHYTSTPSDLDYPAKLSDSKRLSLWLSPENQKTWADRGGALENRLPPKEINQDSWYPSLQKTLRVLSKLHTRVNVSLVILQFHY